MCSVNSFGVCIVYCSFLLTLSHRVSREGKGGVGQEGKLRPVVPPRPPDSSHLTLPLQGLCQGVSVFGAWAFTLPGHPGLLQQICAAPAGHLVPHTLGIAHASLWEGDSHCSRAQFLNSHSHKVRLWFQKPRLCTWSWEGVLCELPQAGPPP